MENSILSVQKYKDIANKQGPEAAILQMERDAHQDFGLTIAQLPERSFCERFKPSRRPKSPYFTAWCENVAVVVDRCSAKIANSSPEKESALWGVFNSLTRPFYGETGVVLRIGNQEHLML